RVCVYKTPALDDSRGLNRRAHDTSPARWQAASLSPSIRRSSGTSVEHAAVATGQRGWNVQPVGRLRRSGGVPGMPVITVRSPVRGGNELISPAVYGWS